jgi:hypothetical protein
MDVFTRQMRLAFLRPWADKAAEKARQYRLRQALLERALRGRGRHAEADRAKRG